MELSENLVPLTQKWRGSEWRAIHGEDQMQQKVTLLPRPAKDLFSSDKADGPSQRRPREKKTNLDAKGGKEGKKVGEEAKVIGKRC